MTTKQKIANLKAGKIYRCVVCDAVCDDTHMSECVKLDDVYMGRQDKTKARLINYCSETCQDFYYRQSITESLTTFHSKATRALSSYKNTYKKLLLNPPEVLTKDDVEQVCDCGLDECECSDNDEDEIAEDIRKLNQDKLDNHNDLLEKTKNISLFFSSTTKFIEACLGRKTEYELLALQLKSMHMVGPVIEDSHDDAQALNIVLKIYEFIKCVDIHALSCWIP